MSHLNLLSLDIIEYLFEFLQPLDTLNLCIAENIKSTKVLHKLKSQLLICSICDIHSDELIASFNGNTFLCDECVLQCCHCSSKLKEVHEKVLRKYIRHKIYNNSNVFIPGYRNNCVIDSKSDSESDSHYNNHNGLTCGNCLTEKWEHGELTFICAVCGV